MLPVLDIISVKKQLDFHSKIQFSRSKKHETPLKAGSPVSLTPQINETSNKLGYSAPAIQLT
ncbi:hypothetical protein NBRC116583_26040 [Arenicella sp. 4NH20-0111]